MEAAQPHGNVSERGWMMVVRIRHSYCYGGCYESCPLWWSLSVTERIRVRRGVPRGIDIWNEDDYQYRLFRIGEGRFHHHQPHFCYYSCYGSIAWGSYNHSTLGMIRRRGSVTSIIRSVGRSWMVGRERWEHSYTIPNRYCGTHDSGAWTSLLLPLLLLLPLCLCHCHHYHYHRPCPHHRYHRRRDRGASQTSQHAVALLHVLYYRCSYFGDHVRS